MNRTVKKVTHIRIVFVLILALASCAWAQAETYEANTMRLLHYQGSVEIFDASGESRFVMENVRFSSGETMQTGEDSLASVSLDSAKIVTLDANSRVEFIQEANHFRLNLLQGALLLDVQEKLNENEALDIQTSTMMIGVRGTVIFVSEELSPDQQTATTRLGVMEGTAQIDYLDQSNAHRLIPVPAGQVVTIQSNDPDNGGVSPVITDMTSQDVEGFVVDQVLGDAELTKRIIEGSEAGADILLPGAPTEGEDTSQGLTLDYSADGDWTWDSQVTLVAQSASKLYDGQPLTRPSDVLVYGLPEGVNIQVSAGGSRTEAGEGTNFIEKYHIYNSDGEDVTPHFTQIEEVNGILTVDPAPLIVWTGSGEKYYDGEPLTNPEAELRTVPGYEANEPTWRNTSIITRTALGSENMVALSGNIWVHSTNPLTGETREIMLYTGQRLSVQLSSEKGERSIEFEIETLPVEELPEDILRLYAENPDLKEQACRDAKWDPALLEECIAMLPEQTEKTVLKNGLNVPTSAQDDVMRDSTDVRITIDTEITNYNSHALTGDEAHFTPVVIDPSIVITATGSQTEVGKSTNTYKIDWGNANPANYILSEDLGTLTVLPVIEDTVTIKADSANKVYDGTALEADGFTVTGLSDEYTVEATVEGSQTDAGESESSIVEYRILDENGEDYTGSFTDIQTVSGVLSVTPAPLTVITGSTSKTYDGTELASEAVSVEGLQGSETAAVTAMGSQTDAGTAKNTYFIQWITAKSKNYQIQEALGTLEVTPAPLTVTTGSASKAYDGTALTSSEASIEGLLGSETATATATGSQTDVGTSQNTYTLEWGTAKSGNYTISETLGTLEVTASNAAITLTAGSASKTYDGTALTSGEVTATGLPSSHTVTSVNGGSVTDAGTAENTVTSYTIQNAGGEDVTAYFTNITTAAGKLEVTPAPLTVTTGSASKAYDGAVLTSAEASVNGLQANETATATATGSQTNVGSSENTYTLKWGTAKSTNYTVSESLGTLEVTASNAAITLTAGSASKTYDGTALTSDEVTATGLPSGHTVTAVTRGSITDAGTAENTVTSYTIQNAGGEDVTAYFSNITTAAGTLEVTPAPLTVTTGSASKAYDGAALTNSEASIEGLLGGETAAVTATGSQTGVGTSENTYSIEWGTAKNGNYTITESLGTLEVTASNAAITLTAGSASKTYDGTALTSDEVTATGLPTGHTVTAVTGGSQTNAGSSANPVTGYTISDQNGNDVTSYFTNIIKVDGTLEVYQRSFEIVLGGKFKYDGEKHYASLSLSGDISGSQYTVEMAADGKDRVVFAWGDVMNVQVLYGGTEEGFYGGAPNPATVSFSSGNPSNYAYSITANPVQITSD